MLPESFSYRNHGETIDKGLELGLQYYPHHAWSTFLNYSFQDDPEVRGIERGEINTPPKHRYNMGIAYDVDAFFANANVNFVDEAFWVDVLDSRFWGPTKAYTQVNLAAGVRPLGGRAVVSIKATNVFDAHVQQHVFGDIINRRVVGELRMHFD
jgi:outer membrane receptor protein involved in Fe transport